MDRMPKEFKIIIYLTSIHAIYSIFYFAGLFFKFLRVESPVKTLIIYFALIFTLLFLIPLILFFFKNEAGRIWLIIDFILEAVFNLSFAIGLIYFKETASLISRLLSTDFFTPYLILATMGMVPKKSFIAFLVLFVWCIYILVLLFNKDLRKFIKEKEYPAVNTQKYTSTVVFAYFISLAIITFLINL